MRNKLNLFNVPIAVACVAGAALVVAFVLGYYSWQAVAVSAVIGLVLGIPLGIWATRKVRRGDPAWPDDKPI